MNADGTNPVNLTNNPTTDREPSWSPDGGKIAFGSFRGGSDAIWVMNADGTNPVQLTSNTSNSAHGWSADGRKIVFQNHIGNDEIFVVNADGTGQTNLTNNPTSDAAPS